MQLNARPFSFALYLLAIITFENSLMLSFGASSSDQHIHKHPVKKAHENKNWRSSSREDQPKDPIFNVKQAPFFAKGDGVSDDTTSLQKAMDSAEGTGGTVVIPKGVYRVNAIFSHGSGIYGVRLRSRMSLKMAPEAVIKAFPNNREGYAVLTIADVQDINLSGGTLEGERSDHQGKTGEWGMGLTIRNSQRIIVQDITAKECWGDGFYVAKSTDITLEKVKAIHNRRQGLSIIGVDKMLVTHSIFSNTQGTLPEAGIDIEPNEGDTVKNVTITNCQFYNNSGWGITSAVPMANTNKSFVSCVVLESNHCHNNGFKTLSGEAPGGIEISNMQDMKIKGNTIECNAGDGILVRNQATKVIISNNKIHRNGGNGVLLYKIREGEVSRNTITDNKKYAIRQDEAEDYTIKDNIISGNGRNKQLLPYFFSIADLSWPLASVANWACE